MDILAVLAHPNRESFTAAVLDEFVKAAKSAGHGADVLDLYRDGFDPRFNEHDVDVYCGKADVSGDVAAHQQRIMDADAMAFFYPVWWWSMPAMLKGWIDRVFTSGFAFDFDGSDSVGLLKHSKVVQFCPAASDQRVYRRYGYHGAFQRQIDAGIFGYCGIQDVKTFILPEVEGSEEARAKHLALARQTALDFDKVSGLSSDAFC